MIPTRRRVVKRLAGTRDSRVQSHTAIGVQYTDTRVVVKDVTIHERPGEVFQEVQMSRG